MVGWISRIAAAQSDPETLPPSKYLSRPVTAIKQGLTGKFADSLGEVLRVPDRTGFQAQNGSFCRKRARNPAPPARREQLIMRAEEGGDAAMKDVAEVTEITTCEDVTVVV